MTVPGPLTLGTAGHIDHGKTALVGALTGVDTDRLPEERARGISIALGYAPLRLPSGRALSVVDVPGHERFVRTMVAGATGIDCFLMVVAADDGVMPQTVEHAEVLRGLGVRAGVVAVTKSDVADPRRAVGQAGDLLPGCEVVACSARTGDGVADVAAALDRLAARLPGRSAGSGGSDGSDAGAGASRAGAVLHIDRAFTVAGRGTVVTGTLWSGSLAAGDAVELLPRGERVRVRAVQVHDRDVARAVAGQRVAANLTGVKVRDVARGDALAAPGLLAERTVLDCALDLRGARHAERVHVHHGTRDVPARLADHGEGRWQLRLERPLLAADGDHVVIRRLSPPDTLGGGVILDASARRRGRHATGGTVPPVADATVGTVPPVADATQGTDLADLDRRLLAAGAGLLAEGAVEDAAALRALRADGRAVRVSGRLYAHREVVEDVRARVVALIERDGSTTLAGLRDELGTSRKSAQAFLEHLDAERVTRRLPDDSRVLARRGRVQA